MFSQMTQHPPTTHPAPHSSPWSSCAVPALATLRYRFQGREYSAATGLTNFRARWYDPETGRWLSKDPIGLAGGLNLYALLGLHRSNWCKMAYSD